MAQLAERADTSGGSVKRFKKGTPVNVSTFESLCVVLDLDPLSVQADPENPSQDTPETNPSNQNSASPKYQHWDNKRFQNPEEFQGRTEESEVLKKWIVEDKCRLVTVFGIGGIGKSHITSRVEDYGGIGKSTLSSHVGEENSDEFKILIWESFLNPKNFSLVLEDLVIKLSDQKEIPPPTLEERIDRFIFYLKKHRCLIVFDNLESGQSKIADTSIVENFDEFRCLSRV